MTFARALLVSLVLCSRAPGVFAGEPELVNIQSVDKSIVVELRYGTTRNMAQRPLYPPNMPALLRPQVAAQLSRAQAILRSEGYGLKIWDAYRPKDVHEQLWRLSPKTDYVADPAIGGSLHTCGTAVDATMVDSRGREVSMPTDFDDFRPAAMLQYAGANIEIRQHLRTLQNAMGRAGFRGVRTEWWHFVSENWKDYQPIPQITIVSQEPGQKRPAAAATVSPAPRERAAAYPQLSATQRR